MDLGTGDIVWQEPLGTVRDLAPVPIPLKYGVPNLGDGTEGVTAEYGVGESRYTGYIVSYSDSAQARGAFERYSDFLRGKAKETSRNGINMFILDSGGMDAAVLQGSHIVGVWGAEAGDIGFVETVLASLARED